MSYTQSLAIQNADGCDNIRLFRILSNTSNHERNMRCEAQMFSLREAPRYSALSYCWRMGDNSESIEFQGCLRGLKLLSNDLTSALRTMQRWQKGDWLWVDAICIDQSNVAEKNDQVPRMQMIYEGAKHVIIWLGEAVPRKKKDDDMTAHPHDLDKNAALGLTSGKVVQLSDQAMQGRAWWTRVWTIQEMVVATQLYVCIGPHKIHWHKFVHATINWDWYDYSREFELQNSSIKIRQLDEMRKCWRQAKHSFDVLELLDVGRRAYATDARDNIYGLLGLMRSGDRQRICVDYNRNINRVYAETTAMIIERQRSLDFLIDCFSYKASCSQSNLPSWVLDFGDCQTNLWIGDIGNLTGSAKLDEWPPSRIGYQASANTTPKIRSDATSLKLDLQAVFFDNVVASTLSIFAVSDIFIHDEEADNERIRIAREWLRSAVRLLEVAFQKTVPPSDPRSKLFRSRTIKSILAPLFPDTTRKDGYKDEMLSSALVDIDRQYGGVDPKKLSSQSIRLKHFWNHVYNFCESSVLFTTTCGFAGIAHYDRRGQVNSMDTPGRYQSACPNDVIVIPLGSSKPWILRRMEAEGEYILIIDCVIQDIMSGEVMTLVEAEEGMIEWITVV